MLAVDGLEPLRVLLLLLMTTTTTTNTTTATTTTTKTTTATAASTFRFLLIVLERLWGNEFTKIILNGSPQDRFEHSGVLPGAKLHAEHDGNSETIN